jgi:NitT/TauT family transport system substrate-binding protein
MNFSTSSRAKKSQAALFAVLVAGSLLVATPASNAAAAVKIGSACSPADALGVAKNGKTVTCKSKKWTAFEPASIVWGAASATWQPKEEFAVYAVPKKLNYFKQENLTVSAVTSAGSIDLVNLVAAGRVDIGGADLGSAMQGIQRGANIVIIGGLVQNFPWNIAVKPGGAIKTAMDLKGKKIGIIGFGSGSYPYTKAWLAGNGLKESDVTLVPTGAAVAVGALQLDKGDVDAIAYFKSAYAGAIFNGSKFTFLPNPEALTGVRSLSWIVNADKYFDQPEVYERYLRAANKGLIYSTTNVRAATLIGFQEFPTSLAVGKTDVESLPLGFAQLKAWLETATPTTGQPVSWNKLGAISASDWKKTQDYTAAAGTIVTGLNIDDFLSNDDITKANSFDRAKIVAAANKQPK